MNSRRFHILSVLLGSALFLAAQGVSAGDPTLTSDRKAVKRVPTQPNTKDDDELQGGVRRSKSLSFDDEVIEGMNRNPYDSLENVANRDGREKSHLYQRRTHFKKEMRQLSQEAGYSQ